MKTKSVLLITFLLCCSVICFAQDTIRAITLMPSQDAERFFNNGTAKFNAKLYVDALPDFTKAIELKPDFEKAYYSRGLCRVELIMYKIAIEDFMKSIELNPAADYSYFLM